MNCIFNLAVALATAASVFWLTAMSILALHVTGLVGTQATQKPWLDMWHSDSKILLEMSFWAVLIIVCEVYFAYRMYKIAHWR